MIFFAIGIHEYCHCKFADMAGDPTPAFYGRVTLNLFKHFDLYGTIMIAVSSLTGLGIGWGKPAPINPSKMRNPRLDTFIAVSAGPLSNLLQATLYAFILRAALSSQVMTQNDVLLALGRQASFFPSLLVIGVEINIALFLFNLIPFGILDGHWLVGLLMPEKQRYYWFKFNRTYGWPILVIIILMGQVSSFNPLAFLIGPPFIKLFGLLTGLHLSLNG
ncbi:MAG TPA: site-2 protease family protein [Fimbriimonadaceae bacterium]|nr:site-2 protease family protein [Fimbriimonadaceae bacterium]